MGDAHLHLLFHLIESGAFDRVPGSLVSQGPSPPTSRGPG
jgi:hypothetical protein